MKTIPQNGQFGSGRPVRESRAFSLLEIMVAIAVLALLTVLLSTVFSSFSQVTTSSAKRVETSKQTRTIFDRIAFDIASAVNSGRTRLGYRKNAALAGGPASRNDALVLLTDARTSDPDARLARVGYAVGPDESRSGDTNTPTVLRHVEPFGWDEDTTTVDLSTNANAQPIAPGVIRFELAFVNSNGDILAAPPAAEPNSDAMRQFHENLSSIICAVATLDERSMQRLTPNEIDQVINRLDDAVDGQSPVARWETVEFNDLPRAVTEGLRFHQRYFRVK